MKVCTSEIDCQRISVQYFGEPAAPQYLLYIKMKSQGSSLNFARTDVILGV